MARQEKSIKQKLISAILITTSIVLLLTTLSFIGYELVTYRQTVVQSTWAVGQVVAANSGPTLMFDDPPAARQNLASLRSVSGFVEGAVYDQQGRIFARYPLETPVGRFPQAPEPDGSRFDNSRLVVFLPIVEENKRYGTLYLSMNVQAMRDRLKLYGLIVAAVMVGSFLIALGLSSALQRR